MHNKIMRAKMNVKLPKTVNDLYTLANKCARAEEGRRLPGEHAGIKVDSDDDEDAPGSKGRNRKHNKKRKVKALLVIEGSSSLSTGKKAKVETPARELLRAQIVGRPVQRRRLKSMTGQTSRSIAPRAMISTNVVVVIVTVAVIVAVVKIRAMVESDVKIVGVSADDHAMGAFMNASVDAFVPKPMRREVLIPIIQEIFDKNKNNIV
ncbi:hypothetical protein ZWY2020_033652 [Hordeum vulgare]|nr:hypothetical protein ZWY2020_033652 [Hordeum vulgare]